MQDVHWIKGTARVLKIDDALLQERFAKYKPIIFKDGEYYRIDTRDTNQFLRNTAFTWEPKILGKVDFTPSKMTNTDHLCGYIGFFKPSVAEVLAQLPDDLPAEVNAFWLDSSLVSCYDDGSGHMAITTFGVTK
jgi:hypothetical protein